MNPPGELWSPNPDLSGPQTQSFHTAVISPSDTSAGEWEESEPAPEPATADEQSLRDRRQFPRRDSHCTVCIVRHVNGAMPSLSRLDWQMRASQLRGELLDISMNAAAFQLSEPLKADESLHLRIRNPRSDLSIDTEARVLRCTPAEPRQWKVVCRIKQNLTVDQLHNFGYQLFSSHVV